MKKEVRQLIVYLVVTFVLTFALEIPLCIFIPQYFTAGAVVAMLMPTVGVLAACGGLTRKRAGIRWKPDSVKKKHIGWLIFAWFAPLVFIILGGALYFCLYRGQFDAGMIGYIEMLEQAGVQTEDGAVQGVPIDLMVKIQLVQCITIAPAINCIVTLGEEIGWRGFLTPTLSKLTNRRAALIIAGLIWGIWHSPLIVLVGYEYGTGYFGEPWLGVVLFMYITTLLGIIHSFIYEKTDTIIGAAILHAAFNAAAALPLYFISESNTNRLIGPAPVGIISSVPLLICAVVMLIRFPDEKHGVEISEKEDENGETAAENEDALGGEGSEQGV